MEGHLDLPMPSITSYQLEFVNNRNTAILNTPYGIVGIVFFYIKIMETKVNKVYDIHKVAGKKISNTMETRCESLKVSVINR